MNFERLDKNSDGYVSREEAKGNKSLESSFKGLDKNNDGKLSRSELDASSAVGSGGAAGAQGDADRGRPVAPRDTRAFLCQPFAFVESFVRHVTTPVREPTCPGVSSHWRSRWRLRNR
jgi:hypothetical protein